MNMEEFMEEYGQTPGYIEQMTQPRVLRARWSQEIAADLEMVHGINAEEALGEIITEEIANELNLDPIVIPMVRRVMPQLMARELAEVQPMTGAPMGMAFALSFNPENGYENITVQPIRRTLEDIKKEDHFSSEEDMFTI